MKHFARATLIGALFISFLLIGTIPAFAQCDEDNPNCPIEPPQSVEVNPDAVEAEGSPADVEDPGALEVVESDITGAGPAIIDPVPLAPRAPIAPAFGKLNIPMRWQQATDVSCGVQALGMAFEGLGEGSPSSPSILDFLQNQGMMYDFGTGVEELAFGAQQFGYKGTIPFHNWGLGQLQGELAEGRAPVVALGSNGPGQPGHFVTITGFSPDSEWVSYNDPILGEKTVLIEEFNRLWGLQGNTGVAVRKSVPAGEFDPVPWVAFVAGLMALISQTPWALQRKGIGGRLMAGGVTTRRKTRPARRRSLGGVPSRAAKAASRRKPRRSRPIIRPPATPPRDPSPQMYNTAPSLSNQQRRVEFGVKSGSHEEEKPSLFSKAWNWLKGVGLGLVEGLRNLEGSRFIDLDGQIKFGLADPTSSWKVTRYFHIDMPDTYRPYVHLNADVGPLRRLNHTRLPNFMAKIGSSPAFRTFGRALIALGVAKSTYDVVDTGLEGGDVARATSEEVGAWTGALVGAGVGVALGGGTPLSIPLGILGAGVGSLIGQEVGGALYDFASNIFYGN